MLVPKYHNFTFYVHNLGRFDVVFLLKILLDFNLSLEKDKYIVTPFYRDNQVLRLTVSILTKQGKKKSKINIHFVDSLNFLNSSLDKLCKDFEVETSKGIFPYSFVNKNNLNYVGPTPDMVFYPHKKINLDWYKNNFSTQ